MPELIISLYCSRYPNVTAEAWPRMRSALLLASSRLLLTKRLLATTTSLTKKRTASEKATAKRIQELLSKMPKEEPHLRLLQQQRLEKRGKRAHKTQPSVIYWQVLGSGCKGGPPSLILYTDQRRYGVAYLYFVF